MDGVGKKDSQIKAKKDRRMAQCREMKEGTKKIKTQRKSKEGMDV